MKKFFESIINSIIDFIKIPGRISAKPHHSSTLSLRGLYHSFAVAIAVALAAFIIKPFGLKGLASTELTNIILTIGGITFIIMILSQFVLPLVIKDFYAEEKWSTGKQFTQLLVMSLLISFAGIFYLSTKGLAQFPADAITLFGISVIPLWIAAVVQQSYLAGKFEKLAEEKTHSLSGKSVVSSENPLHVLNFKSDHKSLSLIPNQLIYIKIGNPSLFLYQTLTGIEKDNLRIDEGEILKELKGHPEFEIFGKTTIINVNGIQEVTGTARGYEIKIAQIEEPLKISHKERKKVEEL